MVQCLYFIFSGGSAESDNMNQNEADNDPVESEHEFIIDIRQSNDGYENTEDTDCSATPSTSYDMYAGSKYLIIYIDLLIRAKLIMIFFSFTFIDSKTKNQNNQDFDGYISKRDNENSTCVDGFLIKLGEGLKRLPYNQRSKLEIEFLTRLYEVEDDLGVLDD